MNKEPDMDRISEILTNNAKQIFYGLAQVRALGDVWIKSRYLLSLLEVANKNQLNLNNARILDVACSKCDVLLALQKMGMNNLTGVNLFAYDLKWLHDEDYFEQYFGDSSEKIKYIVRDIDKEPLPFEDSSLDVVLLFDVIEHLHDPEKILKDSYRVLSPGGLIIISTPNVANLRNRVYALFGKSTYWPLDKWLTESERINDNGFRRFTGHVREYTMKECEFMLKKYGFNDILLRRYYASHINAVSILYHVYSFLERLYPRFRYHMLVIGKKSV